MTHSEFVELLDATLDEIEGVLIEKNRKYGNSALEPARIFSRASPLEQLNVRIDDKISRIQQGELDDNEDAAFDLLGYLILREVAKRAQQPVAVGLDHAAAEAKISRMYPSGFMGLLSQEEFDARFGDS